MEENKNLENKVKEDVTLKEILIPGGMIKRFRSMPRQGKDDFLPELAAFCSVAGQLLTYAAIGSGIGYTAYKLCDYLF